jgi:hypothetical protein
MRNNAAVTMTILAAKTLSSQETSKQTRLPDQSDVDRKRVGLLCNRPSSAYLTTILMRLMRLVTPTIPARRINNTLVFLVGPMVTRSRETAPTKDGPILCF